MLHATTYGQDCIVVFLLLKLACGASAPQVPVHVHKRNLMSHFICLLIGETGFLQLENHL